MIKEGAAPAQAESVKNVLLRKINFFCLSLLMFEYFSVLATIFLGKFGISLRKRRRLIILGSTGSVGTQTLSVAENFPEKIQVVALTGWTNMVLLADQILKFRPGKVCVASPEAKNELLKNLPENFKIEIFHSESGLVDLVRRTDADLVLTATVGFSGLLPTLAAIESGKTWPSPIRRPW